MFGGNKIRRLNVLLWINGLCYLKEYTIWRGDIQNEYKILSILSICDSIMKLFIILSHHPRISILLYQYGLNFSTESFHCLTVLNISSDRAFHKIALWYLMDFCPYLLLSCLTCRQCFCLVLCWWTLYY